MFYGSLGLMYGAETTLGELIGQNIIPAAIGNYIGGALLCGGAFQLLYFIDSDNRKVSKISDEQKKEEERLKRIARSTDQGYPTVKFIKRFVKRSGEVLRIAVQAMIVFDQRSAR